MSHCSSHTVKARAWYSASAEDLDMVACFLDHHDINESPKKMQKPVVDFLVSMHMAQSESEKAFSWIVESVGYSSPCAGVP